MRTILSVLLVPLLAALAFGADDADHTKLIGSWQVESGANDAATWTFTAKGDSLKVTQTEGGNTVAEFVCNTDGKPCDIKTGGKRATVSMWFNGPKLVELETKGSEVIERRFLPAADDLQLEVVPMVPSGKTESVKCKRTVLASAKQ